jgi:hypothetical protein
MYEGPVDMNPLLRFHQDPIIEYDLNQHPSFITTTAAPRRLLTRDELSQHATTPPRPYIHLVAHNFPWTITITPSASHAVTILDVLSTLYSTLRIPVTQAEFVALPSQEDMRRASEAYRIRSGAIAGQTGEGMGVRRVDFLMGRTFLGFSGTTMGSDFWVLNVA